MNNIEIKKKAGKTSIIVSLDQGDSMTVTEFVEALNKCPDKEAQVFLRTCFGTCSLYGLTADKNIVEILWYQD